MAALFTPTAFGDLTAAQVAQLLPIKAIKGGDETLNNNAGLQNDDALFVPVAASATYRFEAEIRYSTNTTANLKLLFTFPVGLTMKYDLIGKAATTTVLDIFPSDQTTTQSVSGNGAVIRMTGTITVAAAAGTLQLQWAQNTANVSNTTVQAGSHLILQQIA